MTRRLLSIDYGKPQHLLQAQKDTRVLKLSQAHRLWPTKESETPSLFDAAFSQVLKNFCCLEDNKQVVIKVPVFLEEKAPNTSVQSALKRLSSRVFSSKQF